jgi:predicted double-glycine peptidase
MIYSGFNERYKPDERKITWSELERDTQERALMKDPNFRLEGLWKKFLRNQDGYKVFIVDGEWIRNNLSVIFGHGTHGYVHEWCPNDEIWIAHRHTSKNCCNTSSDQRCTDAFIESTILHEITENKEMGTGKSYWESHNISLEKEKEAKFLENPYDDSDSNNGYSISMWFQKDKILDNFPNLHQTEDYNCSVFCILGVLEYYGVNKTYEFVESEIELSKESGSPPINIVNFFRSQGFKVKHGKLTEDKLKESIDNENPIILPIQAYVEQDNPNWRNIWSHGHYVVLVGYTDNFWIFEDPSSKHREYIKKSEFLERWHDTDGRRKYINYGIIISQ